MEATVDAPVSSGTETPSGNAPATAEPSQGQSTQESRPTSMREAFERIEKKQQASRPDAGKTGTATTEQPATGTKPDATPAGPVPLDVHTKALENARTKAVAEYRQKFGWAEKIPQQQLQQWGQIANRIATDRVGFASDFLTELSQADPAALQSVLAKFGGAKPSAATPETPLDPDVEIRDEQGRVVGKTFSAERVQALMAKAVKDAIGQEVQPLKAEHERRQAALQQEQRSRLEAQQADSLNKATQTAFNEVRKILDITTTDETKFSADDNALFEEVTKLMATGMSAHSAALDVREKKIVPKLKGAATQEAISEFQRKAAGTTASGAGKTAMPKRPTNAKELAAWMRDRETSA